MRANWVSVRDGEYEVLADHLGAYDVLEVSIMGPEVTDRFLAVYAEDAGGGWYEEDRLDGGLLVDWDDRVLMAFATPRSPRARAAWLDVAPRMWPGWEVCWAYDGIGDFVTYLGEDLAEVRSPAEPATELFWSDRPDEAAKPRLKYLVSVGDTAAYALSWRANEPWRLGPAILDQLRDVGRVTECPEMPVAGLHLDPASRTAGLWTTSIPLVGLAEQWESWWPGWRLELWADRIEEQIRRCAAGVEIPALGRTDCRSLLAELVVDHWSPYVAEDVDDNLTLIYGDSRTRARYTGPDTMAHYRIRTAVTRAELSAVLRLLTGAEPEHPVYPRACPEAAD
ncbi:hypothetical protein CS0771_50130 [Catellatospora sp. IY07-71]|nr:hypothetical protein CS0771_50130 [Catellatospora sp. IY07-71]